MSFQIKEKKHGSHILVVKFFGVVARDNAGRLRLELRKLMAKHQPWGLILEFSGLGSIDRVGIQKLIEIDKICWGRLILVNPNPLVAERLRIVEHGDLHVERSFQTALSKLEEKVRLARIGQLARALICRVPDERNQTFSFSYPKIQKLAVMATDLLEQRE